MKFLKARIDSRLVLGLSVVTIVAVGLLIARQHTGLTSLAENQFNQDVKGHSSELVKINENRSVRELDKDGTIRYLHDDFSSYINKNQTQLASFNSINNIHVLNSNGPVKQDGESYKDKSIAVPIKGGAQKNVEITEKLTSPKDLSRWQDRGYVTMWLHLQNRAGIQSVSLKLSDTTGNSRYYDSLLSLQTDYPNTLLNDPYEDLALPYQGATSSWTDFWLNSEWNYLPWRADKGYFKDTGKINMGKISSVTVIVHTSNAVRPQTILLSDARMVDGLQRQNNELGGAWYPPLDAPQYGVFDVDKDRARSALKIQNVRQTQYPSNGDHGRLLSEGKTPINFAMSTRFSANNLSKEKNNTYLRFLYDFDPYYDPGHDWFGTYLSLDYKKAGLLTVKPLQRFTIQTQEPLNSEDNGTYRRPFSIKQDQEYELDVTVRGQKNITTLYRVEGQQLKKVQRLEYTFERPRSKVRNPLAFEVTGNAKLTLYDVKLVRL